MTKFCRTCAESIESENYRNLFEKDEGEDNSRAMVLQIKIVTSIKLTNDSEMPSYICQCCLWDLKQAWAFRERCINAQKLLVERRQQELLLKEEESHIKLAAGKPLQLEDDFEEDTYENDDDETLANIINVESTMVNDEVHCEQMQSASDEFEEKTNSTNYTANKEQHTTPLKQMTSSKHITKSKKTGRMNSMTDPLSSVCEKCGKTFASRSNLKEHLLRHLGVRKYQCPLCSYKSYTTHLLRRHLIKHGDKRPYACKYCDKTFRSGSGRHDHEKTHTENGPFQCSHCERTFTKYSGRIRHEALHTRVRSFQCQICNVSFVWRRHLEQHNRCKSHKRAEFEAKTHINECPVELLEPADHVT